MTIVGILTHTGWEGGGGNILFPIFRGFRALSNRGIRIKLFKSHTDSDLFESDVVIVIHRYFHVLLKNTVNPDKSLIIQFLEKLRSKGIRIIFFDAGDGTGSRELDLLPYVDKFLKKQLHKDRSHYLKNQGDKSVRCWISQYDESTKDVYKPAEAEHLNKLQLGWNIGLTDFRAIPYIHRLGHLTNRLIWAPRVIPPGKNRELDTQFRGSLNPNSVYADQRNQTIETLRQLVATNKYRIQLGPKVPRRKFLQELAKSRVCISPFGWGELCYRDFEAIQMGCILIKPDISHLETFPNYFLEHKTYVPIRWDVRDLPAVFKSLLSNYDEMKEVARNSQELLSHFVSDNDMFAQHFQNIISS